MTKIRRVETYLGPKGAERFTGLSRNALIRYVQRGAITHFRTSGGHRRYALLHGSVQPVDTGSRRIRDHAGPYFTETAQLRDRVIGPRICNEKAAVELPNSKPSGALRLLVFAYACEPGRGSEPGAGWGLVHAASSFANCTILIGPEHTAAIAPLKERRRE